QKLLALKNEDIASIETRITDEIEAYLQKLQQYEQTFAKATQQQYPLNTTQLNQLRQEQKLLGLKDENIALIENRIKAEIEAYLQKLQHYEQALIQTIQHEYPFSEEIREELRRYQHVLELGDEEVARIEEKVVRRRAANQPQIQQLNTYEPPVVQSHLTDTNAFLVEEANSDELPTQFLSRPVTQVIPDTEHGKTHNLPPLDISKIVIFCGKKRS
ncbi:MAG: hypothetical protein ICV54_28280, partial [Nostoc sp. C3-bin3]|nr:hypothetical protein [Nostoc sp. C3-bin3]